VSRFQWLLTEDASLFIGWSVYWKRNHFARPLLLCSTTVRESPISIQSLLHISGMTGGFVLLSFPLFDYINGSRKLSVMLIIIVDVSVL
jgi:hypothetical protein